MAMKTATTVGAAGPRGLRSLFSTLTGNFPFPSQPAANQPQRQQLNPSTNLFVSGLSKRTTDKGLRKCFAKFGEVVHARVVKDRAGWSEGFGYVRYSTLEGAAAGIVGMDGKYLDGWVIFAEYAISRDSPSSPSPYGTNQYGRQRVIKHHQCLQMIFCFAC
ncbi:organelle RRM domain-containing protein 2, mitochondrial-like [Rutidosis leptorrhynchoides]|uniref:organelle RRM domain-containing protein 2, mitochondrial-like n=1 Tax=Rutidosis leptorrhynchoides TaxID=125765 RepID=UPI003A9A374F